MRLAHERHHVVLAMGRELDVAHEDHVVVAFDFLEHRAENVVGILMIAAEELFVGLHHALGRVQKAFAPGIVADPAKQRAHGVFRLRTAGTFHGQ